MASTDSDKTENIKLGCCNVCNAASSSRCAGCSLVVYCGREHQVEDWKGHKKTCSLVKRVNTGSGFEVQAKVDIPLSNGLYPKQVMKLNPMLLIPVLPDQQQLQAFSAHCPTPMEVRLYPCLGCYQLTGFGHFIVDPDRGLCTGECLKCGWPVHNEQCGKNKVIWFCLKVVLKNWKSGQFGEVSMFRVARYDPPPPRPYFRKS